MEEQQHRAKRRIELYGTWKAAECFLILACVVVGLYAGFRENQMIGAIVPSFVTSAIAGTRTHLVNASTEWQCIIDVHANDSSIIPLKAELLINDTAGNGTSKQTPSLNYNNPDTCDQVGKSLPARPEAVLVHVFYPIGEGIDPRKKHLMIMSFLATQCSATSKLIVWHKHNETPVMLPMAEHLRRRIQVRKFGAKDIEEMGYSSNITERLIHEWRNSKHLASRTDIARTVILYNHGGIWVDSDCLLLRSLSPISGLDFAYQAQDTFLNNAVMGASTKQSNFIRQMITYIDHGLITNPTNEDYFKWGASMFHFLFDSDRAKMPFFPGCLFDQAWTGGRPFPHPAPVHWDSFFGNKADDSHVDYIDPKIARFGGPLVYHWHGRWKMPIVEGSLADRADRMYRKALGIPFYTGNTTHDEEGLLIQVEDEKSKDNQLAKDDRQVNCGGHYAKTCAECSHGSAWCNGECKWLEKEGACVKAR
jgi:hypothetical protein